ncbi:MAG: response regulator [Nitrospirae bacterium]|nr:response regulator [Nitrospirota bacterium]
MADLIIIVDDDDEVLGGLKETLAGAGYNVAAFGSGSDVLEYAATHEPRLVISDIVMPEMGGFDLKEQYGAAFPGRATPFVFMSSLTDPVVMVKGLDSGAEDYLVKPVHPEVMKAKVRSILGRKAASLTPIFHGDLARYPFVKLMQFCELKGLTGSVEITAPGFRTTLGFKAGNVVLDGLDDADSLIERLYDLTDGGFSIHAVPVDFSELGDAMVTKPAPAEGRKDREIPMGKLSGIDVNGRLLQVQTEFVTYPSDQLLSIVILDGKVVYKKSVPPPAGMDKTALERVIEEQHTAVEGEVRDKISGIVKKKESSGESVSARFSRFFESGFEKYRDKDYAGALADWEEAYKANPTDKTLQINLSIVRKKLQPDTA